MVQSEFIVWRRIEITKIEKRTLVKIQKFLIALIVYLFAIFYISGCSRKSESLYFVLVPKSISNPYWFQAEDGMKAAGKKLGVKVELNGPVQAADVTAQVNIMESLIARHVSGIAISPNDPDGVTEVIDRAMKEGIPVLTFDSDAPKSKRICYIGTDNYQAGREAGKQMIKFLGEKGEYAIMTGGLGALNLNERIRGFRDELKAAKVRVKEVNILACNDDPDKALLQIEDMTRSMPTLDAWFVTGCWATVSPQGAFLNALNHRKDMVIIGFDTVKEELLLVKAGLVQALIGQRPYDMGEKCVETLYDIVVNKKKPQKEIIDTGVDVITQENVEQFLSKHK